jgi:DNA-directed RNA polymerase specialized sigma24 family protein
MSKLTPEDQSLLRDYYWDGKEYTDIAFEKGMSRSTVNRKLRRAKINFYEAYQRITRAA